MLLQSIWPAETGNSCSTNEKRLFNRFGLLPDANQQKQWSHNFFFVSGSPNKIYKYSIIVLINYELYKFRFA
jgi:hypothetical protein